MNRLRNPRDERGVAAIFFGLSLAILMAGLGLSMDIGNVSYQDMRAQQAADTAARQIAGSCAKDGVGTTECATSQASIIVARTFPSAVTTPTISSPTKLVTVTVDKDIPTTLLSLIGIRSKHVRATAKASWNNGFPVDGTPVLPMGVPYCMYKNNLPPATARLLLRTDVVSVVFNVIVQGGVAGRVITTLLGDLAGITESCTPPPGYATGGLNLRMLRGPIWLSGLEGAVNGLFNWNSSICNMHLGTISGFLGSTVSSVIPPPCVNKLGSQIKKGQLVLLPVYVPSMTFDKLGLEMDACLLGICSAKVPPRIGVKVLGFTPFRITGWKFPGNSQPDPAAPACASITLLVHPSASVGCNGIQGYFLKSITRDPNFTYGPAGADFGASSVKLTQ